MSKKRKNLLVRKKLAFLVSGFRMVVFLLFVNRRVEMVFELPGSERLLACLNLPDRPRYIYLAYSNLDSFL